jgi:hypothetical protein
MALIGVAAAAAFSVAVSAAPAGKVPFPRPDTHRGNWIENHGLDAQVNFREPGPGGSTCLVCHEKNDCVSCHATRPPRDHRGFWRTQGHGLAAGVNREQCLICHRQDACVRCHNETAPRSHTAGWINRHCQWCHRSGSVPEGSCGVCHRRSPH